MVQAPALIMCRGVGIGGFPVKGMHAEHQIIPRAVAWVSKMNVLHLIGDRRGRLAGVGTCGSYEPREVWCRRHDSGKGGAWSDGGSSVQRCMAS